MREESIYSLGNPGTFDITDKDDPQYYIARLSHELSVQLYNLSQEGFTYRQNTESEMGAMESALDTWNAAIATWLANAVSDAEAGDEISALPTPPDLFPSSEVESLEAAVIWLLIRQNVQLQLMVLRQGLSSSGSLSEVARAMREAWVGKNGSGEKVPYILLMAQHPFEILINRSGEIDSVYYDTVSE